MLEGTSCIPYSTQVDCHSDTSTSITSTVAHNAGTPYLLMFFTDGESYTMVNPEITISAPTEGAGLELMNLMVAPSAVTDRQFVTASFALINNGPKALSYARLLVEYDLSNDTTFGDSDDRKIGKHRLHTLHPLGRELPLLPQRHRPRQQDTVLDRASGARGELLRICLRVLAGPSAHRPGREQKI
jgi:hypothetical protein